MVRIHTTYAKGPIRSFYFAQIFGEIRNCEISIFVSFSSKMCSRNEENRQFLAGFSVPIFLDYTPLWEIVDSNHRRHCQQIYSLSPLATREISHAPQSWWTDLNPRPIDYKSIALPAELHQRMSERVGRDSVADYTTWQMGCQAVFSTVLHSQRLSLIFLRRNLIFFKIS